MNIGTRTLSPFSRSLSNLLISITLNLIRSGLGSRSLSSQLRHREAATNHPSAATMGSTSSSKGSGKHFTRKSSAKHSKGKGKKAEHQPPETLEIWVAVFRPYGGHWYHWSIGAYDNSRGTWHMFEAIRESASGPFMVNYRPSNPQNSSRCIRPLTFVGSIDRTFRDDVFAAIHQVRTPRGNVFWNCQDYVDGVIWALVNCGLLDVGVVEPTSVLLEEYRGGMVDDFADIERQGRAGRILSAEFVVDSDSD